MPTVFAARLINDALSELYAFCLRHSYRLLLSTCCPLARELPRQQGISITTNFKKDQQLEELQGSSRITRDDQTIDCGSRGPPFDPGRRYQHPKPLRCATPRFADREPSAPPRIERRRTASITICPNRRTASSDQRALGPRSHSAPAPFKNYAGCDFVPSAPPSCAVTCAAAALSSLPIAAAPPAGS